jgi:hypothetical protein
LRKGGIALVSIIYDALNKTQEIRQNKTGQNKKPKFSRLKENIKIIIFTILFISILSTIIIYFNHHYLHKHPIAITANRPTLTTYHAAKSYQLDGVFLSDHHQVAIINHAYYHIGDKLDGMKVVSLSANEVKLKDHDKVLTLSMLH